MSFPPQGLEVLVVDDDPALASLMEKTLTEKNLSVTVCSNSHEALEKLTAGSYNLIFTDIYMPGISGIEFAAYCREKYPSMAIVIMTGAPSVSNLKLARDSGVVYYLAKPFSDEEIDAILKLAVTWNLGKLIDRASRRYLALANAAEADHPGKLLQVKVALKEFLNLTGDAGQIRKFVYDADIGENAVYSFLSGKQLPQG